MYKNFKSSVYLVTDNIGSKDESLFDKVEKAIIGGVSIVQFRDKEMTSSDFYKTGLELKNLCKKHNVSFFVNDRVDMAIAIGADGVHLGQHDMPLPVARKVLGEDAIIGVSVHNIQEALTAQAQGANYIGVGSIFDTTTKKDAYTIGLDSLEAIRNVTSIPIIGIGGINKENAKSVMEKGADGVAVVSAILEEENILQAAKFLKNEIKLK